MITKKSETKSEVTEIEILTEEQINALPASVKTNVVFLTENMPKKELLVLNPLVSSLLQLQERADKLTLKKDEDGEINKDCIKEYKALKADQRSFNGSLTKTAKAMKDPINQIRSGIIEIEKTFKSESDEIKEQIEEKFKEYEDKVAAKAAAAQAKKDAELNAQINAANEEAEKLKLQQEKMNIYNEIRNNQINVGISEKAADAVEEYSEISLERLNSEIAQKTWETITNADDLAKLEEDSVTELKAVFEKAKHRAIVLIGDRLEKYENEREELKKQGADEAEKAASPEVPVRQEYTSSPQISGSYIPPAPSGNLQPIEIKRTAEDEFIEKVLSQVQGSEIAVDLRIKVFGLSPKLKFLKERFNKFNS